MDYRMDENVINIPRILPANGHDIYNYVARYGIANFQIQTVMKLDGRLDPNKLLKSVRLSVDAEPILGCRFVEDEHIPYWKRLDDIDKTLFCSIEETNNLDKAVLRFLESPLDMDKDPMVKIKLIRSGKYDTLCVKNNHACCDGGGVKDYLQLLSDIYTCIDHNNGTFVPKPVMRGRKDQDRIFMELGIEDPEAAWDYELEALQPTWAFPWHSCKPKTPRVSICRLPYEQLSNYARASGAKINDIVLTAFYRAMFEMLEPQYGEPMEIQVTVDLRRYLPDHKTEAIRNLSGSVNVRVARLENEPFGETLSRVTLMMNEIKNNRPGLQSAIGLERLEKLNFNETLSYNKCIGQCALSSGKCSPVLSNFGFVGKPFLRFGENLVTDAYMVTPAVRTPGFLLAVSTYNGILTLAVSYYDATTCRDDVDMFLKKVQSELIEGCI